MLVSENPKQTISRVRTRKPSASRRRIALGVVSLAATAALVWGCGRRNEGRKPAAAPGDKESQLLDHLAHRPADVQARLELANLYYDSKRPHMAIPFYQEVLKQRPDDPAVRTDLGTCYKRLGALVQAKAEYERVIARHPEYTQAIYNLGVVVYLEGDYRRAVELWEQVAKAAPGTPTAQAALQHASDARSELARKSQEGAAAPKSEPSKGSGGE